MYIVFRQEGEASPRRGYGTYRGIRQMSHARRARQSGSAMIEMALIMPVAAILFMGMIDIGQIFLDYLRMSEVTYEGARLAAKMVALESPSSSTIGATCSVNAAVDCCYVGDPQCPLVKTNHALIHNRVEALMRYENIRLRPVNPWRITVSYNPTQSSVSVSMTAYYRSFFSAFGFDFPINVATTLPYLYES